MIESSQLQTLVAVARSCSFSKAADELGVTQSAISQSIKNLEKKVNCSLFKRSGKQVVLTDEGTKLFDLAQDYLSKFDDLLGEISHDKEQMRGKVKVGTLFGLGKSWLGYELINFSVDHPQICPVLNMGFPHDLIEKFEKFKLDCVVVPEFAIPPSGVKERIGDESCVLVIPSDGSIKINDDISFEDFCKLPTILYDYDDGLYAKWVRKKFGHTPKKINRRLVINSHGNILKAVSEGLGIAILPTHVLDRSSHRDKVKVMEGSFQIFNSEIFFVCHKENIDMARLQLMKEVLKKSFESK